MSDEKTIELVERKSAVLTPSRLACLSDVATVNLTAGCTHDCVYCYTRGYRSYPGRGKLCVYANTATRLREELRRKRRMPSAVYFSPSSDLFQPVREVQELTLEVLHILLEAGLNVAFLSKGKIPAEHLRLFKAHASQVQAQIGVITMDEEVRRVFEPNAAPSAQRIEQARQLTAAGIPTTGRVDPILPGVTDAEETFRQVCFGLASAGVTMIAASVLFLRPAINGSLRRLAQNDPAAQSLLREFQEPAHMSIHAGGSSVLGLPHARRQKILESLASVANDCGISTRFCACKNPDLSKSNCRIAGHWRKQQRELFDG